MVRPQLRSHDIQRCWYYTIVRTYAAVILGDILGSYQSIHDELCILVPLWECDIHDLSISVCLAGVRPLGPPLINAMNGISRSYRRATVNDDTSQIHILVKRSAMFPGFHVVMVTTTV